MYAAIAHLRARARPYARIPVQAVFLAVNAGAVNNLKCMLGFANESLSIDLPSVFIPLLPCEVNNLLRVTDMARDMLVVDAVRACMVDNVVCLAATNGNLQIVETLREACLHARVGCHVMPATFPPPSAHSEVRSRCTPARENGAPDTTLLCGEGRPRESCGVVVGFRCAYTLQTRIAHP